MHNSSAKMRSRKAVEPYCNIHQQTVTPNVSPFTTDSIPTKNDLPEEEVRLANRKEKLTVVALLRKMNRRRKSLILQLYPKLTRLRPTEHLLYKSYDNHKDAFKSKESIVKSILANIKVAQKKYASVDFLIKAYYNLLKKIRHLESILDLKCILNNRLLRN